MGLLTRPPVVCALDASLEARSAAHFTASIAHRLKAPLVLAHVTTGSREDRGTAIEDGLALLTEVARGLPADPELELRAGEPSDELVRVVDALGARMVAVGAHPPGALKRAMTGTFWCRVVADAACPVVVVGYGAEVSCEGPVVAGYDGSTGSDRAIAFAAGVAAGLGTRLLLVNVMGNGNGMTPISSRTHARLRESVATVNRQRAGLAHRARITLDVEFVVRRGETHAELERVAEAAGAAMVVVGSRERGPVRTPLLGSVSGRLVETARRPVVVVPGPGE